MLMHPAGIWHVSRSHGQPSSSLHTAMQSAIVHQAAALRKVDAAALKAAAPRQQEGGLEAALRAGLEKFKFDDTRGTTVHGDDTTGDFSAH